MLTTQKQKDIWSWYKKDTLHDENYSEDEIYVLQLRDPRHDNSLDFIDGNPYDECDWHDHLYIDFYNDFPALFLCWADAVMELDDAFSNSKSDLCTMGIKREWIELRKLTKDDIDFIVKAMETYMTL